MKYFRFTDDYRDDERWVIAERQEDSDMLLFALFRKPGRIPRDSILYYNLVQDGSHPEITFSAYGTPIVSQRAAGVMLEAASDDLDLVPAKLVVPPPEASPDMVDRTALKILPTVDCIDMQRSKFLVTGRPPRAADIKRAVIIQQMIGAHQILRTSGNSQIIIVTEALRAAVEAAALSGAMFEHVETS